MTTRAPSSDACKSRLAPLLSLQQRQTLQKAMILDELSAASKLDVPILIFATPSTSLQEMEELVSREYPDAIEYRIFPQEGNELGAIMKHAFQRAFSLGYSPCILIGSDIPSFTDKDFEGAFDELKHSNVVMSPTLDGGYCLIGMNELYPEAFAKIEYGTKSVLEQTVQTMEGLGIKISLLSKKQDIDAPDDLFEFYSQNKTGYSWTAKASSEML